jgi:predicted deacylase
VHGVKEGPTLYIHACVHGEEVTGAEIIRQVTMRVKPSELAGTLIMVPIANTLAYLTRSYWFALEERSAINMNRVFPGDPNGFLTERLAHKLFSELTLKANYAIDLHSGTSGANVYPNSHVTSIVDDPEGLAKREMMATACGIELIFEKRPEEIKKRPVFGENYERSFAEQCRLNGITAIQFEMGEGGRISWEFVDIGVRGILNVMRSLGMLSGAPDKPPKQVRFQKRSKVRANRGGLLHLKARLGDDVREGEVLAEIADAFSVVDTVVAPVNGKIIRVLTTTIVYPGAEVAWIAH